jgi:hypothetical protein
VGHRTGIGTIFNDTSVPWNVFHQETRRSRSIPAGGNATFNCDDIFPWVSDTVEMASRGLQFRSGAPAYPNGTLEFLTFQNYLNNQINWALPAGTFPGTRSGVVEVGCAGVRILASNAPAVFVVF